MEAHRLPGTHYRVRTGAFLWCMVTIGLHLWERSPGLLAWTLLVLQFAVYPHVVYWRALRSANPTRAELDNLALDSVLLGLWCGALGFPLWISYMLTSATVLNAVVNRGARWAIYSLGCVTAGGALGMLFGTGFHYQLTSSPLVTAMALFGSLAYACSVGQVVHVNNRRLVRARDALKESEARYRLIAENAADLIALVDAHGRWHYASPSYEKMLDAADLAPGADLFRRMHPDDAAAARAAVERSAQSGKPREIALRLIDKEGRVRQLKARLQAVDGKVVVVSQDVTELKASEEKLLLAAHALEGMAEAILIASADGTIVTVNRAFSEITGLARDEVIGQPETVARNALQPADFYAALNETVKREGYWSGTTWSRRKNGSVYREWRSVRAVRDGGGAFTHFVTVFYEVGSHPGADTTQPLNLPLRA